MVVKVVSVFFALVLMATLSGCQSEEQKIKEVEKLVQTCKASGGDWYAGYLEPKESCHFDTRYDFLDEEGSDHGKNE